MNQIVAHGKKQARQLEHARIARYPEHRLGRLDLHRLGRGGDELDERQRGRPAVVVGAVREGAPEVGRVHLAEAGGQRVERAKVDLAARALEVLREQVRVQEQPVGAQRERRDRAVERRVVEAAADEALELVGVDGRAAAQLGQPAADPLVVLVRVALRL